jgi:hypothetical protein
VGVGGQRHALAVVPTETDPVPIVPLAGWAPEPVRKGAELDHRTIQPVAGRHTDCVIPAYSQTQYSVGTTTVEKAERKKITSLSHINLPSSESYTGVLLALPI